MIVAAGLGNANLDPCSLSMPLSVGALLETALWKVSGAALRLNVG